MSIKFSRYKVTLLSSARKNLRKIPFQDQLKILKKLDLLKENQELLNIKKLKGFQELYRIRSGDYRIIYKKDSTNLAFIIAVICHRQEVYKLLKAFIHLFKKV